MTLRRRIAALALAGGALPLLLSGPAHAARPGRDLAVVSMKADDSTAATGQLLTVTVVAVNHGRGQVVRPSSSPTWPGSPWSRPPAPSV
jgi:hypothetical protein